jgi:hypothetical protein
VADEAAVVDEAARQNSIANNEALFERGLEELRENPAKAAGLQSLNQSFVNTPWVHVPDFVDDFDGEAPKHYKGVMMSRLTPLQGLEMLYGKRGRGIADRLIDRNKPGEDAPFPIIRGDGRHMDASLFAFQNMGNGFPEAGGAIGMHRPVLRYSTWNGDHAAGKVPYHELIGHGLMDGGASNRNSQKVRYLKDGTQVPEPWESDIQGLMERAQRRIDRVDQHFLGDDEIALARHPDAVNHSMVVRRLTADPSELRAIGFTLKHDAADVFGVNPVTRADSQTLLDSLLGQGYRRYDAEQPVFKKGPRQGQEAPYFNEEQRGLKTYFDSLTPEDQEIFRDLWFRFGKTDGGSDGQAGQSLVA